MIWFTAEIVFAAFDFLFAHCFRRGAPPALALARARCLQRHSRRILRVLGVEVSAGGRVPASGLLVSNHLSYLDVLVLSTITPAVFVAKSEVRGWPVFGWLARRAGTLFIERAKRSGKSCRSSRPCSNLSLAAAIRCPWRILATKSKTAMRARTFATGAT